MSGKRVAIGLKPGTKQQADAWVAQSVPPTEMAEEEGAQPAVLKRLTIDVSEDLHRRLKVKAAQEGVRMADLVRRWIEDGCGSS
jgi:predicted HicB family RNase H-like nuclease